MKISPRTTKKAFTLLELTVVIMVLLALMGMGLYVSDKMRDWKLGRQASESLREVYSAQRLYLADNPTASVSSLTSTLLIPYLPNQATTMPTVTSLKGTKLSITITQSPPVINDGSGGVYDPSGSSTDSLWDLGE
jgi:prepilin-type N-terminal cleavage/methylation domain-containing protein